MVQVHAKSKTMRNNTTKVVKEYLHNEVPGSGVISEKFIILDKEAATRALKGAPS